MSAIDQSSVMDRNNPVVVEIYAAGDCIEAHAAATVLEDEGIEVQVVGEMLDSVKGGIPFGEPTAPRLWVASADAQRGTTAGAMADADIPAKVEDIGRCISAWREADFCRTICVGRLAAHRTGNV
ncbi:hypothetical protein CA54_00400 [Symmachiella macrocystis]|uniref:DUF2007 domain-containing protein n=1 Tax=Symmachiella macrocystis TaxID=2527985 RepID=A0A5C6BIS5_9PLAN|nr:DUF2007 domain-containing protein [Symmachiella macrocystis]TWU11236.1 hypothetical protein CA54_00400 [Symmachiella macrocystis]